MTVGQCLALFFVQGERRKKQKKLQDRRRIFKKSTMWPIPQPIGMLKIAQSVGNLNKNTTTDAESCKFESVKVTQSTPSGKYAQPEHLSPQRETQDEKIYSQVSFAEYSLFYRALLPKRRIILMIRLFRLEARFEYSYGTYFVETPYRPSYFSIWICEINHMVNSNAKVSHMVNSVPSRNAKIVQ